MYLITTLITNSKWKTYYSYWCLFQHYLSHKLVAGEQTHHNHKQE
jgi:hypothetical protein